MSALKDLSDAATPGAWYTVDTPWGDGSWIVAGNPDPHVGTMVCDCEDLNETRPEDGPDAADDAAFIAALVTAYRGGKIWEAERVPFANNVMQSDLRELLLALDMGDHARPQSPHEVFQEALTVLRQRLRGLEHASDCALHGAPALPVRPCNCGAEPT